MTTPDHDSQDNQASPSLDYLSGFGNEHHSEALAGALPIGQASPQKPPYGLYAEKISGTAFTAPRASNRRTWFYRIRPSVIHGAFRAIDSRYLAAAPINNNQTPPDQLRWDPLALPSTPTDFVDGLRTFAVNGNLRLQTGVSIHCYVANKSMPDRYFYDADGELLLVPQSGRLQLFTECGKLDLSPGEIAVIPRGFKFRVDLVDDAARGYVCENHGAPLGLPERGPVGSDGFANDRDFLAPVACYEDREGQFELTTKFAGKLFACEINHSPLDVVAWFGTYRPYKYDLSRFNTMGSVSYDHPDPSIYTVLSSLSDTAGVANVDFVIFPPRWVVAEGTFRPPWYHRNVMSEFMGLIHGAYDGKAQGFVPGGCSVHNSMTPHGPDTGAFSAGRDAKLEPQRVSDTLACMFESRYQMEVTPFALNAPERQSNYQAGWAGLEKHFTGSL